MTSAKFVRPCEDVIIISDHEEGEITDSDSNDSPLRNKGSQIDSSGDYISNAPAAIPPDKPYPPRRRLNGAHAPSNLIRESWRFRRRYSVTPKILPRNIAFYKMRDALRPTISKNYPPRISATPVRLSTISSRINMNPARVKSKARMHRRKESSCSESDAENVPKKIRENNILNPKKITSLQLRLSNMMKYTPPIRRKPKSKDIEEVVSKPTGKSDINGEPEDTTLTDENLPPVELSKQNVSDKLSDANEASDDDPDILRELALKSKTKRVSKPLTPKQDEVPDADLNTNKIECDDLENEQALRMAALKSAILKKANKRKTKREMTLKEKRRKRLLSTKDDSLLDIDPDGSLIAHINSEDILEYNSFMYNVPDPSYGAADDDETKMEFPVNYKPVISKEPNDEIINEDDAEENEDTLRLNLLASMKKSPKTKTTPVSPESKLDVSAKDTHSSLLITLGGSDTESECEETKNLAIMRKKLEEPTEFQRNLDQYLKGVRRQAVETKPVNGQRLNNSMESNETLLNNLTLPDRQEYQSLVNRINEFEKKNLKVTVDNNAHSQNRTVYNVAYNKNNVKLNNGAVTKKATNNSLIINRKILLNSNSKGQTSSINERSRKIFEQQLLLIRKKINNQMELVENQKKAMKILQLKRETLMRQIKNDTLILNNTEKSLRQNHQTQMNAHKQLTRLRRHQLILQNRFPKHGLKKLNDNTTSNIPNIIVKVDNNLIATKNVVDQKTINFPEKIQGENSQNSIVTNMKCENSPKILDIKTKLTLCSVPMRVEPSTDPKTENSTISNSSSITKTNTGGSENGGQNKENENIQQLNFNISKSDDPPDIKETYKIDISKERTVFKFDERVSNVNFNDDGSMEDGSKNAAYIEYDSPLLSMKANESWNKDPQAILCPFDVGGCCKDPTCKYIHMKDVNMANNIT